MPFINQPTVGPTTPGATEAAIPGTMLDLAQTDSGNWGFFIQETSGLGSANIRAQFSPDGSNWYSTVLLGVSVTLAASATIQFGSGNLNFPSLAMRYVQLAAILNAGTPTLLVLGGFAK